MYISVIICTYNHSESLKMTLKSIEEMSVPEDLRWELILVDNNSSDETRNVVREFMKRSGLSVKYVYEGKQGLGHARIAGCEAATGDILAFTDDDCIVDRHWLSSLAKEFQSDRTLSGAGGRVELFDIRDKPVTIMTSKERVLLSWPGQLFNFIHGCNMAFVRRVFQVVGNYDVRFGAGTKIASAEDSDFIYRVFKSGFKILYSPDFVVYHNHGRRTDAQVRILMKGYIIGRGAFYCKHILKGDLEVLKMAYREIYWLVKNIAVHFYSTDARGKSRERLRLLLVGVWYYLATSCRAIFANVWFRHGE